MGKDRSTNYFTDSSEEFDVELNIALQNGFIIVERKKELFAILEKSCK